jgi:hypothetical protein
MSFSRLRSTGLWTFDSVVEDFEFEAFDENLSHALDGKDGGAYVLDADMSIGGGVGASWTFTLPVDFDGDVAIGDSGADDLFVNSTFNFDGVGTFSSAVEFFDDITFSGNVTVEPGGDVLVDADLVTIGADFDADFVVNSGTAFNNAVAVDGDFTVQPGNDVLLDGDTVQIGDNFDADFVVNSATGFYNSVTFNEPVTVADTLSIGSVVSFTSSGKIKYRQQVVASDANQTVIAAQVDTFYIPTGVFSADRQVQIDDTGAQDGMRIFFMSHDSTNHCTVLRPGGAGIGSFGGASGQMSWAERIAGIWQMQQSDE